MKFRKLLSLALTGIMGVSMIAVGGATTALAAPAGIEAGSTYYFRNAYSTSYALNVYGTSTSAISNNTNVTLWEYDTSDIMQQFQVVRVSGETYRLKMAAGTVNYYVDRLSNGATTNNPLNNAQAYTASSDSNVTFESTDYTNQVKICQTDSSGTTYYLTAVSGANGSSTGKSTTSAGNVYWSTVSSTSALQRWKVEKVGSSSSSGQKLRLPINGNNAISASMAKTNASAYYTWYGVWHYGADLSLANGTNLYGLGSGTVIQKGWNDAEGNYVIVQYDNCLPVNGGAAKNIVVRYFHMSSVSVSAGNKVTTSTLLGKSGNTGNYAYGAYHLHMEFDTDTTYPAATPSLTSGAAGGGLTAGVRGSGDTTVNPFDWMYNYSGQTKSDCGYENAGYNYTLSADLVTHTP